MIDTTHYCFRPVWVEGANESRLGYVIELGHPMSTVYVNDCGIIEVKNSKLHFLLGETHSKMRVYVYQAFGLSGQDSTAITRVKPVFA